MKTNKPLNKRNVFLIILMVALFTAAFFYKTSAVFAVRKIFIDVSRPLLEKMHYSASLVRNLTFSFFSNRALFQENEKLKIENENLTSRLASLFTLEKENLELREILKIKETYPSFEFIKAGVVGLVRDGGDEYIFISQGTNAGVHSDLLVLTPQNTYVGRIAEAYTDTSKVKLITSSSETTNGMILPKRIGVLLRGNVFREFIVDFVPENAEVNEGDIVVSSGILDYSNLNPVIGRVVEVKSSVAEVFKNVKALHNFDPQSMGSVVVVVKKP